MATFRIEQHHLPKLQQKWRRALGLVGQQDALQISGSTYLTVGILMLRNDSILRKQKQRC